MGSTTPPWRSLDAPSASSPPVETPPAAPPSTGSAGGGPDPVVIRVVATVVATAACAALAIVVATSGGSGAEVVVDGAARLPATSDGLASDPVPAGGQLVVEVVGAVRHRGVYRLPPGSRIGEAIAAAGGYGPRVDTDRAERELNLAAPIKDGDQIRVPSRDDPAGLASTPGSSSKPGTAPDAGALVDLNSATAAELDALPGIGPVTVEKILAAREEAPFGSIDDLRSRGLVGEKTFERIRASLVVR